MRSKSHLGRVASLPCALCSVLGMEQTERTEVHHIREGQGMQQRSSDWLSVPLCSDCHRGPRGVHGDRGRLRQAKASELDLLSWTIARLSA